MATNPLSTIPNASTTGYTPAPNLGVTAGDGVSVNNAL